jgi:hypothetical protein
LRAAAERVIVVRQTSMVDTIPFASSDAWLLHAILIAAKSGEGALEDIVAAADMINHAMLTFDEIDGGLARLSRAGLVLCQGKKVRVAADASKIYAGVAKLSIPKATETLRVRLGIPKGAAPFKPTPRDPNWRSGAFSPADLAAAEKAYRKTFAAARKKSRGAEQ